VEHRSVLPFLVVLLSVAGCSGTPEADGYGWAVNGVLVPDEPWRGHDGPFLAALFLTDDADAVYERWRTQPGGFRTGNINEAVSGDTVEAVVVFARCQPDRHGNCQVWGKATVVAGSGRVLARQVEVPLYVGHPPPPDPALGIAEHGVALVVNESSSPYAFHMVVSDRVAGREVKLVNHLAVAGGQ
jgi:hypothetical protein